MDNRHILEAGGNSWACSACNFRTLCLAKGLNKRESLLLDSLTQQHQHLPDPQNALYWSQDEFKNIYAVRSGCLKTYTVDGEGREHIRGFHLPGDLIGLDAIFAGRYPSSAVAVEPSEVCVIPYESLGRVVTDVPSLQRSMLELISKELCVSLALAGDFTAEQRIAAFLLHFYQRMKHRGMAVGHSVQLPMPRRDVAGYLRLAIETVSRVLGRFEREGWIEVDLRDVTLQDMQALWTLAEPVGICESPIQARPAYVPRRHQPRIMTGAYA